MNLILLRRCARTVTLPLADRRAKCAVLISPFCRLLFLLLSLSLLFSLTANARVRHHRAAPSPVCRVARWADEKTRLRASCDERLTAAAPRGRHIMKVLRAAGSPGGRGKGGAAAVAAAGGKQFDIGVVGGQIGKVRRRFISAAATGYGNRCISTDALCCQQRLSPATLVLAALSSIFAPTPSSSAPNRQFPPPCLIHLPHPQPHPPSSAQHSRILALVTAHRRCRAVVGAHG